MYPKSHGKFIFFELPTFDPANKLQISTEFHKQKTGGSHQSSKYAILKILDFGDSLYNNTFDQSHNFSSASTSDFLLKGSASTCERVQLLESTNIGRCENFESFSNSETLCTLFEMKTGVIFSYSFLLISRSKSLNEKLFSGYNCSNTLPSAKKRHYN